MAKMMNVKKVLLIVKVETKGTLFFHMKLSSEKDLNTSHLQITSLVTKNKVVQSMTKKTTFA